MKKILFVLNDLKAILGDDEGSNMGEYVVIGALVLLVALVGFQALGVNILGTVLNIAGAI